MYMKSVEIQIKRMRNIDRIKHTTNEYKIARATKY